MKKILFTIIALSLFVGFSAEACSPLPDVEYPTIDSVLTFDSTAIGLYQPLVDGPEVPAQLYIGNENSLMNMGFAVDQTSCGMRSNDFKTNEYIVAIYDKEDTILNHTDLDGQFSIPFLNQEDAIEKYNELFRQWDERVRIIGEVSENGDISYVSTSSSLRPGMKNDDNVLALQTALKAQLGLGEEFKLDGSYGPATTAAVEQFQQLHDDLENDGIAGVLTQAKLAGTVVTNQALNENETINTETQTTPVDTNPENLNTDLIDTELRKILLRAKNEITRYAIGVLNYTDAHSLVVKYNNELLAVYEGSDPLYKSSQGGEYFVYSAKVSDANYICVDNNSETQVVDRTTRPDSTSDQVSC